MTMTNEEIRLESLKLGKEYAGTLIRARISSLKAAIEYYNDMSEEIYKCQQKSH